MPPEKKTELFEAIVAYVEAYVRHEVENATRDNSDSYCGIGYYKEQNRLKEVIETLDN